MFTGVWAQIKLIFRRDRVKLPVWILAVAGFLVLMVPLLENVYGDESTIETLFMSFGANPAGLFLTGPMYGANFGSLVTIETVLWFGITIAFMNILLVVRHTRQNEEMGAQELILSGRAHRASSLISVLLVAVATNVFMAIFISLGMMAFGGSHWGANEAWLYGVSLGLFGMVWAVAAAVVAQLTESARSTIGILAGLVGVAFVLRGVGDFMGGVGVDGIMEPTMASAFSPFGWLQATRALVHPDWWPLIIPAVFIVLSIPVALLLLSTRDVGAGILPSRKGKGHASAFLRTPLGITWRVQKNVFFGWLAGVLAMGVIVGVLVPEMSHVFDSSSSIKVIIEALGGTGEMIPTFLSAMMAICVLLIIAYSIQALSKLRSEEANGYLENLLATRMSRIKWMALHGLVVLVGGAMMLALTGAVLAICTNMSGVASVDVFEYLLAGLSYLPVLAFFVGLYMLLFGILPRAAGAAVWVYYGFVVFAAWIAPMLQIDQRVLGLSPLEHVAAAPAESVKLAPILIVSAIGVAGISVGMSTWRQRDLKN